MGLASDHLQDNKDWKTGKEEKLLFRLKKLRDIFARNK